MNGPVTSTRKDDWQAPDEQWFIFRERRIASLKKLLAAKEKGRKQYLTAARRAGAKQTTVPPAQRK